MFFFSIASIAESMEMAIPKRKAMVTNIEDIVLTSLG